MRRPRQQAVEANLDISPLIDMVFILLIFFMVSSNFVKDMDLELERPGAQSAAPASAKALRVFVDRAGDIFVDEQPVKAWMLQPRVRDLLASAGEPRVLVVTDLAVPAERLIEVVDQCRLAGAEHVGVATSPEAGP
jgi:biopolymer transport protein ExbD